MEYYIGIDIGTSSTKSVLFDTSGKMISKAESEYDIISPKDGYAEENPLDWLNATKVTLKELSESVDKNQIKGIGLSGQMHGLVLLDKNDNILYNAIIWCDNRTSKEVLEIEETIGKKRIREITGNYAMPAFTLAKLLWIKNNEPDIYKKINKAMLPKDYIRYMLTKSFKTEYSDASGMQILDIKSLKYSDEILTKFGIDKNIFPTLIESNEISGYLTNEVASSLGLSTNTFICGGAGDQAASAIGNGIISEGEVSITLGSSGVIFAPLNKLNMDNDKIQYFCHAIPNTYHAMAVTNGCGTSLKWFRNAFCKQEEELSSSINKSVYEIMTLDLKDIKPGSNGIIYLPYLMGERTPNLDPYASGMFLGIRPTTTKSDMMKAIIEGVSYSMKDCFQIIDVIINKVLISGGGANNPLWCEIISSMINKDVNKINVSEGGALGVAILAMVAGKAYPSIEAAINSIIKITKTYNPNQEWNDIYNKYFVVYKKLYQNNKEIFKLSNDIKGEE